jgi:putative iron-regulated protein
MKLVLPRPRLRSAARPLFLATLALSLGCSSTDDADDTAAQQAVIDNYAANVAANYADTLETAKKLQTSIHAFVDAPSTESLTDAKQAWLAARDPYGLSEAYRFYQGPIDNDDTDDDIADGPEPLLNSWPLDESVIDYVAGEDGKPMEGGIINLPADYPTIDAETLAAENAKASETSITTGYHAIEFLLWGQDFNAEGPGDRPYTDYVTGEGGTAEHQDRRGQYLTTIADLLVDDVDEVNSAWLEGEKNYRADFQAAPPLQSLGKIFLGMGSLSGAELSGERMGVAYKLKEQEDEHSCFSDNTLADLHNNATSIRDVLTGKYGDNDGPGVDDLIEKKDAALAQKLRDGIQEAIDNIDAIDTPFDQAILGDDTPERKHIKAAIDALHTFTTDLQQAAKVLGVPLDLESE